jgi:hypothetical protein
MPFIRKKMFDGLILSIIIRYTPIRDMVNFSIAFNVAVEDGGYNPLRHDAINSVRHHLAVENIHAAAAVAISSSPPAVISLVVGLPAIFFLVEGNACFNLSNVDDFWNFIIQHYRCKHMADSPEMYHHLVSTGQWISKTHIYSYATYGVDDYERYYAPSIDDVIENDWHDLISPRKGRMRYSQQKIDMMVMRGCRVCLVGYDPSPSQSTSGSVHP